MRGDEIDGGDELRMLDPRAPDFAGRDLRSFRHAALDALNLLDQVFDLLIGTVDGFVADHDGVDIAVAARKIDDGANLAFVSLQDLGVCDFLVVRDVLLDPRADRRAQPEFIGDGRNEFAAVGGRVGADRAHIGRKQFQVRRGFPLP